MKHKAEIVSKSQPEAEQKEPVHFDSWYDRDHLQQSKAIIVGVYKKLDEAPIAEDHLNELELLTKTHKIPVVGRWCTHVRGFSAATFLSSGKVDQLREEAALCGANLAIFDDEITAAQQKNLEQALRMPVMDRTEVILGVFADRAKTKEAKLQIEVAQIRYLSPRLKRMWTHLSRQHVGGGSAGGGGYLRGTGEKQIEVDRRILKKRLERLESELDGVVRYRHTQRVKRERSEIPVFAIVGYTNAGKSTLLNRLTSAHVLVEDMLFATLDTTTRLFHLPSKQQVLLVDTVGFIRKLPHLLVAAFKSTLEEAVEADVLIHLVDSSHPLALEQAKTTLEVLEELNARNRPVITVINKVDLAVPSDAVHQRSMIQKLRLAYPRSVQLSALTGEGIEELFSEMEEMIKNRRMRTTLKIPQSEYHLLASELSGGVIHHREYVENDLIVDVELPIAAARRLATYILPSSTQGDL